MTAEISLKRTPLYDTHVAAGARMVPFGGWEMPVQYPGGIISEVRAVRNGAGMFDVSHMGRVEFSGTGAEAFLGTVLSVDMAGLADGRSKYHVICNAAGGIIDDAIVYRSGTAFLLVINAGNAGADLDWLRSRLKVFRGGSVDMVVRTDAVAMIAVQGPEAVATVDRLSDGAGSRTRRFSLGNASVAGVRCMIARTGYTGEDGFELMPPSDRAVDLWKSLQAQGVAMCGLGARDVLRLEAGLCLHGNDITIANNPVEAGLERFLYIDSPGYVAHEALRKIKAEGTSRLLVGFRMVEPGIPRHGMAIRDERGREIGVVTSGTHSPTLNAAIGLGYVDRVHGDSGSRFDVDIRGKLVEAEVVPLPFYSRRKA